MRALLLCIAIVGVSSPALAQPTKVALTIDGDSSSIGLRKAVVGALEGDELQFVSAQKTTRVIEQLGIGEVSSSKEATSVAHKLAVTAVVQGAFDESDHTLKMTVFNVGKKATSFTIDAEDAKSNAFRRAIRKKMLAQIAIADSDDAGDDDDSDVDEESATPPRHDKNAAKSSKASKSSKYSKTSKAVAKKDDEDPEAKSSKSPKAVATADDDEGDDGDEEGDDEDDDTAADDEEPPGGAELRAEGSSRRLATNAAFPAVRIDLGGSMVGRSLKFTASAIEGAPSAYRAKPSPGGHLAAEIYPAAIKNRSRFIGGLGIGGDYDQSTSFTAPAADGSKLKVKERAYSVGVRLRIGIGHRPTSPTVTLGAGYAVRTFNVDNSMPTGVPDVDYRMLDPGLQLRVPIGRRIALFAGGRALLLMSAGKITEAEQYGRAHVTGGTATAGVDIVLAKFVAVRIAGEGTQLDMKFAGQGMLSGNLDGDLSTIDVQKARDRYYGGQATLAVMY